MTAGKIVGGLLGTRVGTKAFIAEDGMKAPIAGDDVERADSCAVSPHADEHSAGLSPAKAGAQTVYPTRSYGFPAASFAVIDDALAYARAMSVGVSSGFGVSSGSPHGVCMCAAASFERLATLDVARLAPVRPS